MNYVLITFLNRRPVEFIEWVMAHSVTFGGFKETSPYQMHSRDACRLGASTLLVGQIENDLLMKKEDPKKHIENVLRLYEAVTVLSLKVEFRAEMRVRLDEAYCNSKELLTKLGALEDIEIVLDAI